MKAEPGAWFDDPDEVLALARGTRAGWSRLPVIPGYADLVEIGRGGQAVVFRARRVDDDEPVAIRVMREGRLDDETQRRRFEREVEIAAALRHPSIVRIEAHGITDEGRPYAVMELVTGAPINETFAGADLRVTLEAFHRVCEAVQHAHLRGIMHRDLKPANIMIDRAGVPRVLDFGLARPQHDRETTRLARVSRTGQFVGSLAWASPEQIAAEPDQLDVRSDVYALGVILYELLTTRLPIDVDGPLDAVVERIVHRPAPSPRLARPDLDEDLAAITLRCLAKRPEQRYETAGALAGDLRRHLDGEPIEARRVVAWQRMHAALRRSRRLLAGALAVVVFLVAAGVVTGLFYRRAATAETLAAERLAESEGVTAYLERMILEADPLRASREITVTEMLDRAGMTLARDRALDPMVRARVALRLASVQYNLGRNRHAELLVTEALRTLEARARDREDRLRLANAEKLLGLIRASDHRPDEADALLRDAIATRRALAGPGDHEMLVGRIHLAALRASEGQVTEAIDDLRAVLRDAQRHGQAPSVATAVALYRIGEMQTFLNDPQT
ncbi:MAG: serine/threonine-protein kinase, partial [Planctomycetota bacterium]